MISTPESLRAAIAALVGVHHGSVSEMARRYGVRVTNLSDMAAGRRPIPAGLWAEIERDWTNATIQPPPVDLHPHDDRSEFCGEALDPHLSALAQRAQEVGWIAPEIVAATLSWAVQQAVNGAGPEAALELLDQARGAIAPTAR